ncbi:MAG: WD40 repeat domain-containing protein [Myxococcales bacterium]|nr:WD40 repeat domain-containing protein [Myxococcales bacterium]
MALNADWEALERAAHNERSSTLRAQLAALDWDQLAIEEDLPRLRALLQRVEQRFGTRSVHRWVSRMVLSRAESVHAEHGFVHGEGSITGVAVSPDGRLLATCNEWDMVSSDAESGTMGFWDVASGRLVQHSEPCAWGLGQRYGSGPGQLQWSPDGRFVHAIQPSASGVLWCADRDSLLEQSESLSDSGIGSTVHCSWTHENKLAYQLGPIREHPFELLEPSLDNDELRIASLVPLGPAIADPSTDELGIGSWFVRARFSATVDRAIGVGADGALFIVDTRSGRVIEWHTPREEPDASPEDSLLAKRIREGAIVRRSGRAFAVRGATDDLDAPLSADGRTYVCVRDEALCAVDLETQGVLAVLHDKPAFVHDVAWDRSGERVAVASKRGVTIWDARRAKKLAKIAADTSFPRFSDPSSRRLYDRSVCAFSRGDTLFALLDREGALHVYDADYREIATQQCRRRASSVAWGADDHVLIVWGEGLLEFWDARGLWRGGPLRRIGRHEHLGASDTPPGRRWTGAEKAYGPTAGNPWLGPAFEVEDGETFAGDELRALVDINGGRPGTAFGFFAPPASETFALFALYRTREKKQWVLVCRPEHRARVLATSALVVNELHGWPIAWADGTRWARVVHTWKSALEAGVPDARWTAALTTNS